MRCRRLALLVPIAVADALGLRGAGDQSPLEIVSAFLASQPALNVSQLTVVGGQLTVHLNREAFDALAALWGITPTVPGFMVNGPATAYADPPLSP